MKKKIVESSIGLKTSEGMARAIDAALKSTPKGAVYNFRRKSVVPETQIAQAERTDISKVTTGFMDRDCEIVDPAGIELEQYRLNPVVLYSHDQSKPVGKCLWIKPDGNGLLAKTYYTPRPSKFVGDWEPDFVWEMVQADVLRGKSIGFLPLEIREPTPEEIATHPTVQRVISRSLLIEYSVVSVPSNPLALVDAVNKGLSLSKAIEHGVSLDNWPLKKIGNIKDIKKTKPVEKKTVNVNRLVAEELKRLNLSPEKIQEQAIKNILARWEA